MNDTDSMDLDASLPLSPKEVLHVRRLLRDDDRASWALKRLRVLIPVVVAVVAGAWQVWDWAARHIKVTP